MGWGCGSRGVASAVGTARFNVRQGSPSHMRTEEKGIAIVGAFVAWTIVAIAIDRYVIRDSIPWLSNLLYFKNVEIVIKPFDRTFTWLGLGVVLVLPSLALGIAAAAFLRFKEKEAWTISLLSFGVLSFWFFLIPLLIWIGDVIYRVVKRLLDNWVWAKGLSEFCDGFVFKGYLYSYRLEIYHIEAGLGAIAGLALGVILYYRFGLWKTIKNKL